MHGADGKVVNNSAERAFKSMSTREGQFTLLLDESFDIIWHSESLTSMLGWADLRGRNGTEFVHEDDLGAGARDHAQGQRG